MDNPYEVLGVRPDADVVVVEAAYESLVKKYHPDNGGESKKFRRIKMAYDMIHSQENNSEEATDGRNNSTNAAQQKNSESENENVNEIETYNAESITDIELSHIVDEAIGELVTKERLVKEEGSGILGSSSDVLSDDPLINYIFKSEQPHFVFEFPKIRIYGDLQKPKNNGYLLITDHRIGIIIGYEDRDEQMTLLYNQINRVDQGSNIVQKRKIEFETTQGVIRLNIDYHTGDPNLSSNHDLLDEMKAAEKFIEKAAFQAQK